MTFSGEPSIVKHNKVMEASYRGKSDKTNKTTHTHTERFSNLRYRKHKT